MRIYIFFFRSLMNLPNLKHPLANNNRTRSHQSPRAILSGDSVSFASVHPLRVSAFTEASQQTAEERRKWKHQHCLSTAERTHAHTHAQRERERERETPADISGRSVSAPAGWFQALPSFYADVLAGCFLKLLASCFYFVLNVDVFWRRRGGSLRLTERLRPVEIE